MAVTKRLRFEILRRDGHTCQQCGRSAPDVPLRVDHVVPVALGGSDEPSNLQATCEPCNTGKSSIAPDSPMVEKVTDDARRWVHAMEQAAYEMGQNDEAHRAACAAVDDEWYSGNMPGDWQETIGTFLAAGLPRDVIVRMVRVAQNKRGAMAYRWAYFCGCCWNRIREMQGRAMEIATSSMAPKQAARLTTSWTADQLAEDLAFSEKSASRWLTQESIDSAFCPHTQWGGGDCGDPVCVMHRSQALSWMADHQLLSSYRDNDIMDAADELNDLVDV